RRPRARRAGARRRRGRRDPHRLRRRRAHPLRRGPLPARHRPSRPETSRVSAPPIRTRVRAVDSEQPDVRAIAAAAAVVEAGGPGAVAAAASVVEAGGLVAFPTESFYGLGADALDSDAVARVFEVKGRPEHKALLVLVDSIDMAAGLAARVSDGARALMARYWPGPLTLVLEAAAR